MFICSFSHIFICEEKMNFDVTGNCYPWDFLTKFVTNVEEKEFFRQAEMEKTKLTQMMDSVITPLIKFAVVSFVNSGRSEKTLKERNLEAVAYFRRTVRQVCLGVHSGLIEGSSEFECAMRSTSMFLLRSFREGLVLRSLGRTGFEYILGVRGLKRLNFYHVEARRTETRKRLLEIAKELVGLNNKIIAEIEQMHRHNIELMKRLEYAAPARIVHLTYDRTIKDLALHITKLQQTIIEAHLDLSFDLIIETWRVLRQLGNIEMYMFDLWHVVFEDQKWFVDRIRGCELEVERLKRINSDADG